MGSRYIARHTSSAGVIGGEGALPATRRCSCQPPAQPLCVSLLNRPRRVRAAPRGAVRRGARTSLHWGMCRCRARGICHLGTRQRSCKQHAQASVPPQPLCVGPLSLPRRVRAAPRGAARRGARTCVHRAMCRCLARGIYHLATILHSCQPPAQASVPPRNPSASAPSACPGACARRRGALPGGVRAPSSIGPCGGALPVAFIILPRAHVPARRTHRRQSSPATPLRQPPQPAPARARGAAGRWPGGVRAPLSTERCKGALPGGEDENSWQSRPRHARASTEVLRSAARAVLLQRRRRSRGRCEGAVPVAFIILPRAHVAARGPLRRQSPPATPLRQPPQPAPARARGAAGRGQAGCAHLSPLGHVKVPCPWRILSCHAPT